MIDVTEQISEVRREVGGRVAAAGTLVALSGGTRRRA